MIFFFLDSWNKGVLNYNFKKFTKFRKYKIRHNIFWNPDGFNWDTKHNLELEYLTKNLFTRAIFFPKNLLKSHFIFSKIEFSLIYLNGELLLTFFIFSCYNPDIIHKTLRYWFPIPTSQGLNWYKLPLYSKGTGVNVQSTLRQ